jgi:prepilin-type N-terminal cleavage/methylation domain-containing protein/prepilin-type processing-associated H-X9-DG protein
MAQSRRAFTLIELLVVIAIIALLMAIIIPALRYAKLQAQSIVCLANLNGLGKAWVLYAQDNNDRTVGTWNGSPTDPEYAWVGNPKDINDNPISGENATAEDEMRGLQDGLLYRYLETPEIFHCPADKRYLAPPTTVSGTGDGGYRSYSLTGGAGPCSPEEINWQGFEPHLKITRFRSSGDKYIIVEEADGRGINSGSWIIMPQSPDTWVDPIAIWHMNRSTLAFADGHGERHVWVNDSTIEMAEDQTTWMDPPDEESGEDLAYMIRNFPYEKFIPGVGGG